MSNLDLELEKDYWTSLLFIMPEDQVTACHLFFSILVQRLFKGMRKEKQNPYLQIYLNKAITYIKEAIQTEQPPQTSFDQTIASFAWEEMFHLVWESPSHESFFQRRLYLQAVKMIMEHYKEVVGDKSFIEYFEDISFDSRGHINSQKAEELIAEFVIKAQKDDFYRIEEKETDEYNEYGDEEDDDPWWPPYYYEDNWERVSPLLSDMPEENAIVFHAIALQLCRKCNLEPRGYAKYQKAVGKAISTYMGNSNQHQKEFSLSNADDAFEKLKEKGLKLITQAYENGDEGESADEWINSDERFSLSSDICLEQISKLEPDQIDDILNRLSLDKDSFYDFDGIDAYLDKFVQQAETEANEMLDEYEKELMGDAQGAGLYNESGTDTDSQLEARDKGIGIRSESSREEIRDHIISRIEQFDLEHDFFFHVIYLNILVSKEIPKDIFSTYLQAVKTAVNAYKAHSDPGKMETARKNADHELIGVLNTLLEKVGSLKATTLEEMTDELKYMFVINALTVSVGDIPSVYADSIQSSLKELDYDRERGDFYEVATDAYALKYMTKVSNGMRADFIERTKKDKE